MAKEVLAIFGASGQGKEVRDIAEYDNEKNHKWNKMVFVDDNKPEGKFKNLDIYHLPTLLEKYPVDEIEFIVALGEPITKKKVYERLKSLQCNFANVVSPDSQISKDAKLGRGLIIKRGAIISVDAVIGDNTTIQSYACIGHDAIVGNHCQISTHVDIGGGTTLGECVFVGLNAPVRELLKIGDYAIISAGAVVLKDVDSYVTVMGNPARVIARNDKNTKVFG